MCDRIAIIDKGNLVALDTTEKLLDRIKLKINFKVKNVDLNFLHMEESNLKLFQKIKLLQHMKNTIEFW